MMQVAEPTARNAPRSSGGWPSRADRAALEAGSAMLSDLSGAAGMVMVAAPRAAPGADDPVPLSQGRALAVLVGEDGGSRTACRTGGGISAGGARPGEQLHHRAPAGRTLAEAAQAMRAEITRASRSSTRRAAIWSSAGSPCGARTPPRARC
jgi:heat-inducible transcriptional repressor